MLASILLAAAYAAPLGSMIGEEREPASVGMSEILSGCLESKTTEQARQSCIGLHARRCLDWPGRQTTAGMEACHLSEYQGWDALLNRHYRALGGALKPELRDAQRAWLTYRDKACGYFRVHYQGGSMARWLGARCLMEETARRAIALHFFVVDSR